MNEQAMPAVDRYFRTFNGIEWALALTDQYIFCYGNTACVGLQPARMELVVPWSAVSGSRAAERKSCTEQERFLPPRAT